MKRLIAIILGITIIFSTSICFTACGEKHAKNAVCFIICNTANSKGINFEGADKVIYDAVRYEGSVIFINGDGEPQVVFSKSFELDKRFKNASGTKLDADARTRADEVVGLLDQVVAAAPEIDCHKAFIEAVKALKSMGDDYDSKHIYFYGTGVTTAGIVNYTDNLICAEPEKIVEHLKEKEEIPDFSGIEVHFAMIETAEPQKTPTTEQTNKIKGFYEGYVNAGGGKFTEVTVVSLPVNKDIEYPAVTPVDFPDFEPLTFEDASKTAEKPEEVFTEPVSLGETEVAFVPDQATYLYPDAAIDNITPIAEKLKEYTDINILLIGCTAGDTAGEEALTLSKNRAEAVKNTLIELGIPAERIQTVGTACNNPWHIEGLSYEDPLSAQNRKVVILDVTSDNAKEVLNSLN